MEILCKNLSVTSSDDRSIRDIVITKALDLLSRIHRAFTTVNDAAHTQASHSEDVALDGAKRRRILHALLDLISLEGVYPSLSPGVGIPLQQRVISVLPAGVIAKQASLPSDDRPNDELLLDRILATLTEIVFDFRLSIQPVIRGRILSDMVSGVSDLAFNSKSLSPGRRRRHEEAFARIVEEYVLVFDSCLAYIKILQNPQPHVAINIVQLPAG